MTSSEKGPAPRTTPEPRDPSKPRIKTVPDRVQPYERAVLKSPYPPTTKEEWKFAYENQAVSCPSIAWLRHQEAVADKKIKKEAENDTSLIELFANAQTTVTGIDESAISREANNKVFKEIQAFANKEEQ